MCSIYFIPHKLHCRYLHFTNEKTDPLKGSLVTCPRLHSSWEAALGYVSWRPLGARLSLLGPTLLPCPLWASVSPVKGLQQVRMKNSKPTGVWKGQKGCGGLSLEKPQLGSVKARSLHFLREARNQIFVCNLFLF